MPRTLTRIILGTALAAIVATSLPAMPRAEAAEPLQFVALGDSVTESGGFIARYREHLQSDLGLTARVINLGTGGSTSGELLERVRANPDYRTAIAGADVITLEIGLNDIYRARGKYLSGDCGGDDNQDCLREMVDAFEANWTALHDEIFALTTPVETAIRPIDIYYPFFASDQSNGAFAVLNGYLIQMNEHIAATSLARDIPLANVYLAFHGPNGDVDPMQSGYLLADQIHTTDAGDRLIAAALRGSGYLPIEPICPDVNQNNVVNIADLYLIGRNMGRRAMPETTTFDVNGDGYINIIDMYLTVKKHGMVCA